MKKLLLIFILSFGVSSCGSKPPQAQRYLIPKEYVGWVCVDYDVHLEKPLPVDSGYQIVEIPITGVVKTSSKEARIAQDEFYYYEEKELYRLGPERIIAGEADVFDDGKLIVQRKVIWVGTPQDHLRYKKKRSTGEPICGPFGKLY